MKVHVTLREAFATTPEERRAALEQVLQAVGLRHLNQRRFERYGIITGEIDDDQLPTLQGLTAVQSVEKDGMQSALYSLVSRSQAATDFAVSPSC